MSTRNSNRNGQLEKEKKWNDQLVIRKSANAAHKFATVLSLYFLFIWTAWLIIEEGAFLVPPFLAAPQCVRNQ